MARKISGRKSAAPVKRAGSTSSDSFRPSRDEILAYIAENPDLSGKRELAKAFRLKGDDRIWLKDMLRDMQDEGLLQKRDKKLKRPGDLPHMVVLDVVSRDADGLLIARPAEWPADLGAAPLVAIRTQRQGRGPAPGIGDRVLAKTFPNEEKGGPTYTARVVKIFDKQRDAVLGVLRHLADGGFRMEPVERRQPELIIDEDDLNGAKPGDLIEVAPLRHARYGLPKGKVVEVVGSLTSEKAVSMIAIHSHDIPHVFPNAVIAEAEACRPATLDGSSHGREDWRDLPLITIDPADAKDHDDAVHAAPDEDEANPGGIVATVAIADVAAYVRPGTELDQEALKRGNSCYFPDRVVPMLPERISNDLCSLRENEDRPALAVRMVFSAEGRKMRHSFHRVMMRSHVKLSYNQAQAAIDGAADEKAAPFLDHVLKPLWDGYRVLKRGRESRQPLDLDLPERKILLKEDGTVDRVVVPDRLDAHKLIEEFMIQANVAAAETLEAKRQPLIYRIHDEPSMAKQESLREFLTTVGLSLARGANLRPSQFNGILKAVEGSEHDELVNQVVLRSQSQAIYSKDNAGHFGLNLKRYAHFTSPIRRYADLIVHRALISALGLGKDGMTKAEEGRLEEISALISATERRAMAAERDTVDRLIAAHLATRIDETFTGRISGVTKAGLFVQLPQFGADGFVPVSTLGDDYYIYDEAAHAMVGERSRKGFRLADTVEVKLVEIAPMAGSLRFEMMSDPEPVSGSRASLHKAKGRRRADQSRRPGGRGSTRSRR